VTYRVSPVPVASGGGSGTLRWARWFAYDAGLSPVPEGELAAPAEVASGGAVALE
jgi:hypothetical protein